MEKTGVADHIQRSIQWILWCIWKNRYEALYAGKSGDLRITLAHAFGEDLV